MRMPFAKTLAFLIATLMLGAIALPFVAQRTIVADAPTPTLYAILTLGPLLIVGIAFSPIALLLGWVALGDLKDKIECRKRGHIPVVPNRFEYLDTPYGEVRRAVPIEGALMCGRCHKALKYEGPNMGKVITR